MLMRESVLRRVDPRLKLLLALAVTAAIMLPLAPLAALGAAFGGLAVATGLARPATAALRRAAPFMAVVFAVDWVCIDAAFAVLITLRLALLTTSFVVLTATTTPEELCGALQRLAVPRRIAFALATAFRTAELLADEWRSIAEAQRARGLARPAAGWRAWRARGAHATALLVPAVVLATQRAWALSEAASVRGLEAPARRPLGSGSTVGHA